MSLFNPFKAHIVATKDQWFFVRKLSIAALGWVYLDTLDMGWVTDRIPQCNIGFLDEARYILQKYRTVGNPSNSDEWYVE